MNILDLGKVQTNEAYRASKGYSNSELKDILANPTKALNGDMVKPTGKALELGTLVHSLVLEPKAFINEYIIFDKPINKRLKADREALEAEQVKAKEAGKTLILGDEYNEAKALADAVLGDDVVANLLSGGKPELSFYSEINGVPVKCRPDYIRPMEDGSVVLFDLKTTEDASAGAFARSTANFGYYQQAAYYSDVIESLGVKVSGFYFIAVEKQAPYYHAIYTLKNEHIELGRTHYTKALEMAKNKDKYLGKKLYSDGEQVIQVLDLPTWIFYK